MNAGIMDALTRHGGMNDPRTLSAVQKLLSEAEMGELFKVLGGQQGTGYPLGRL